MRLLIDTYIFIWTVLDSDKLVLKILGYGICGTGKSAKWML